MLGNVKTRGRKVVLVTIGSLGDLHPFIAVGLALKARGADVVVAAAAEYRSKVEKSGLAFRAVRPSFDDMQRLLGMNRAQLTRAVLTQGDFLLRKLVAPSIRVAYEDMVTVSAGADLLLTSSLCIGARMAAERGAIPWIAIVLQPLMFLSAFDPPVLPQAPWLTSLCRRCGPRVTGYGLRLGKYLLGGWLQPARALRSEIGLAPATGDPLFDGQFSAEGAIALYSKVLGGVRADYPQPTSIVGFATFDSDDGTPAVLENALVRFLDGAAAPIVFTLGSLIVNDPGAFYRESLSAANRLGKRAVLLVGAEAVAAYAGFDSASVFVTAYAPHSLLFPRAAAIVHQGGIGTLAQALQAGRPQLIVPFFGDQLDNAARAVDLGVARSLPPARYDAVSASRELERLMNAPAYSSRAADVRKVLDRENGAAEAARLVWNRLESLAS